MAKRSRSARKGTKRVTRKAARKALSVNDIRNRFKEMDTNVQTFMHKNRMSDPRELGKLVSRQWTKLFNKPLSGKAASSLANHYLSSVRALTRKRGGSMSGAPLDYVMRPGMPAVATYATFPTEVGADPKSVQDLDVYYNSGIGRSCGTENTSATVPPTMGSNLVPAPLKGGRRHRMTRKRGGDFMTALSARAFIPAAPATAVQQYSESWSGQPASVYDKVDPSVSAYRTISNGQMPINPAGISIIDKDITKLASPSPYPAVR
jgi:hypothetical protein